LYKPYFIAFLLVGFLNPLFAQQNINVNNIDIVRDAYGVPHIFTQTDIEAIYGIAWAQCEDNFEMMQDNFAAVKNQAGRLMGKNGAFLDLIYQVFQVEDFVNQRYQQDINPTIEKMLQAYAQAINQYAESHPKEVRSKDLFPLLPKHILEGYMLQMHLMHNQTMELGKLLTKDFEYAIKEQFGKGSNAMAFNPNFTSDEKTYLIGNPHQPVNTMGNFWECSVHSKEGYEFFGATFAAGGLIPVLGTNRNLGWSHTTNYQNGSDVYELTMHPTKKNYYKYDGEWIPLEEKKAKLKVKIGPLIIPVTQKYYRSKYGATFKKKSGYYSFKCNAMANLKGIEQWYKMGLATNFDEFADALNIQGLPGQTITYADKAGNIYHLSNFIHPYRNENFDWSQVLTGDTSAINYTFDKIHPVSDLPQIKNPACGYLYNCNNTVFKMTDPKENLSPDDFPKSFDLLESNTIRANRFEELIAGYNKISFAEARKIREDVSVDKNKLSFRNCMNCNDMSAILAKYPKLAPLKIVFDKWDGSYSVTNQQASLMAIISLYLTEYIKEEFGNVEKEVPEEEFVKALMKAKKFMKRHYGKYEVKLGKLQKAVRQKIELPMYGGINTLANAQVEPYKKGKVKIVAGDSFIFYARYGNEGLEILETVNAFGNSTQKDHPHYTDQLELYVNMQTKTAELNLEKLEKLNKAYHPK